MTDTKHDKDRQAFMRAIEGDTRPKQEVAKERMKKQDSKTMPPKQATNEPGADSLTGIATILGVAFMIGVIAAVAFLLW